MSGPLAAGSLHRQAVGMLVLATLCWALSFPVMKALGLAQHQLVATPGSWFFTSLSIGYRFGGAGLITLALLGLRGEWPARLEIEQGLKLATFGVAGILFQMDGLAYIAASTSAFLTQGYCLFIPLWVAITYRRWPPLKVFISTVLVVTGVAILAGVNWHSWQFGRGEAETLLASLLFTGQILLLERPRFAANRPLQFSTIMFLSMAVLCLPLVWLTAPSAAACLRAYASPAAVDLLAVLIVVSTLGGYLLMNQWQRHVNATEAGLIYCIEPVFASCLSLFLPGWFSAWTSIPYSNEHLTERLLVGGGLIMAANIWLQTKWLNPPAT
jgi:drug/metabolite transporter (DMT)-like permease